MQQLSGSGIEGESTSQSSYSEPLATMTVEEVLSAVRIIMAGQKLNQVQELVFCQCWQDKSYQEIGRTFDYSTEYIKGVAYKLWKLLSNSLGERVTRKNLHIVLKHQLPQILADPKIAIDIKAVKQKTSATNGSRVTSQLVNNELVSPTMSQDWGEASDIYSFYGRAAEVVTLEHWVVQDQCRLIALFGIGGVGKTALAVKLAERIQGKFKYLIWRSLRNRPPAHQILTDWLKLLSSEPETNLPSTIDDQILQLLNYLRSSRCLLILDNLESVLRSCGGTVNHRAGHYQAGYEEYGQLLRCIGEVRHQSCLIFTSREQPIGFAFRQAQASPIRSLKLGGLQRAEVQDIFAEKGCFAGSKDEWQTLARHYAGNPLMVKLVAATVQNLFDSNISSFLKLRAQGTLVFGDIYNLLEYQFNRLSESEKQVMYQLAIKREWVMNTRSLECFVIPLPHLNLFEALESLEGRCLIEKTQIGFTQQPIIMEYIVEKLVPSLAQGLLATLGELKT